MKTVKFVSIFAVIGFLLSLVCGFFSGSSFLRIFLTALIFGFVFAILSFLIRLIYNKFLVVESKLDENNQKSEEYVVTTSPVGQNVNLVVTDEDLEQSGNSNHYVVGDNRQMLNESDVSSPEIQDSLDNNKSDNEFVPLRNFETVTNFSGSEAVQNTKTNNDVVQTENGELDVLPDMSDMKLANFSHNPDNSEEIINNDDSDFIKSDISFSKKDVGADDVQDAAIMAKAISSILSADT